MRMPSQQQYEIPRELQEILLDFTVHYLVEQPGDVVDFALEYFTRLNTSRRTANVVQHSDDESMLSDEEAPSNGKYNNNNNDYDNNNNNNYDHHSNNKNNDNDHNNNSKDKDYDNDNVD